MIAYAYPGAYKSHEFATRKSEKNQPHCEYKKIPVFQEKIDYLCYELSTKGISASPEKFAAIMNFPRAKNA